MRALLTLAFRLTSVEYMLKAWLQGGQKETLLWEMYNAAVDGMEKHLGVYFDLFIHS
eukprot:SAG11_NODE_26500_length_344_cov_0.926531_2_plen_56_part_01